MRHRITLQARRIVTKRSPIIRHDDRVPRFPSSQWQSGRLKPGPSVPRHLTRVTPKPEMDVCTWTGAELGRGDAARRSIAQDDRSNGAVGQWGSGSGVLYSDHDPTRSIDAGGERKCNRETGFEPQPHKLGRAFCKRNSPRHSSNVLALRSGNHLASTCSSCGVVQLTINRLWKSDRNRS